MEYSLQNTVADDKTLTVPQQEFGNAKFVADIVSETLKNMKTKVPEIQRSMQLYLANRETEFILFRPIKVRKAGNGVTIFHS